MKGYSKHLSHYLVLIGILFAGFFGFILFAYDRGFQIAIAIAVALSYVSWGIVHHLVHGDLHVETVVEYLAVASLGLVILFSLVIRT